jgi:hypothetical protein
MLTLVGLGVWLAETVGIPLKDPQRSMNVLSSEIKTRNTLTLCISITPYSVEGCKLDSVLLNSIHLTRGARVANYRLPPKSDNFSIEDKRSFVNWNWFIYVLNLYPLRLRLCFVQP